MRQQRTRQLCSRGQKVIQAASDIDTCRDIKSSSFLTQLVFTLPDEQGSQNEMSIQKQGPGCSAGQGEANK